MASATSLSVSEPRRVSLSRMPDRRSDRDWNIQAPRAAMAKRARGRYALAGVDPPASRARLTPCAGRRLVFHGPSDLARKVFEAGADVNEKGPAIEARASVTLRGRAAEIVRTNHDRLAVVLRRGRWRVSHDLSRRLFPPSSCSKCASLWMRGWKSAWRGPTLRSRHMTAPIAPGSHAWRAAPAVAQGVGALLAAVACLAAIAAAGCSSSGAPTLSALIGSHAGGARVRGSPPSPGTSTRTATSPARSGSST